MAVLLILSLASVILLACVSYKSIGTSSQLKKQLSTTQAQLEKEMEHQHFLEKKLVDLESDIATHRINDQLTGLPSRRVFEDRLIQTLSQSQRYHFNFAVLILDLDGFRVIKNVLGLDACNELLKEVAARFQTCIRPMDTVCRSDGSEFLFLVLQLVKPETAAYVAKRLLEVVARPFKIQNQEIFLTASIGVAVYPNDGDQPIMLLQNADNALLQAKANGNNNYQFYQKEMQIFSQRELSLSSDLHDTNMFNDFIVYYQPWVNTESKKIFCMEAFLHWQHPQYGMIPQQDFLRLAEKSGNMMAIGEWLLRKACQQMQVWQTQGFHPEYLALNVSLRQLENPHFTYLLSKILQEVKLAPNRLIVELSEVLLVSKIGILEKTLHFLKQLEVQVCINHFGAGNISLQMLKGLPINALKVTASLIQDINTNAETEAIVKMIIALADTLKLQVIADGVVNDLQKQRLKSLGCDLIQGDLISPPLKDFTATVEKKIIEQV